MANKVVGDYTAAVTINGSTHFMLIQPGNSSTAYNKISRNVLLGVTGQPADISTTQSFTNKTLDNTNILTIRDDRFTLQDNADTTKQAVFQLSGITTGTTRTYTLPNATGTLVDLASAQTLTTKTITSPVISGGTISNSTISVDAIAEFTAANGVTIDGMNIKDGKLNTNNSVVTANVTDGAITPAKLQSGTGSGWSWTTYTPTWTNVTIGNAVVAARYIQVGKTVIVRLDVVLGNTSATSGDITFSLPVTSVALPGAGGGVISLGTWRAFDASATTVYNGDISWNSTTTALLRFYTTGGTYSTQFINTGAAPTTWVTSDEWGGLFIYEAA